MASFIPSQLTAFQVGSCFVGQYYQCLCQYPEILYQMYSEASSRIRYDGATVVETAKGLLQIHNLIMSQRFTVIEINQYHPLESWNGGVLIMVSGLMQTKDSTVRRKFVQTFFLGPQANGYFVLNDIIHFLDEEQMCCHPAAMFACSSFDAKLHTPNPMPESVSEYKLRARDFVDPIHVGEKDTVDGYCILEQQETYTEGPAASFSSTINAVDNPPPAPVEEPMREPPKQTYASILRNAKEQSAQSLPHEALLNKRMTESSEWHHVSLSKTQQFQSNLPLDPDKSSFEAAKEAIHEGEGDIISIYVANLPLSILPSDLHKEFRNFGRIKPDGVIIRSRKETGACYAFIEFDDASGVHNALKASPIELNGQLIHVERKRPNTGIARGSRGGYHSDAPWGRFGSRTFGRGSHPGSEAPVNQVARDAYDPSEALP